MLSDLWSWEHRCLTSYKNAHCTIGLTVGAVVHNKCRSCSYSFICVNTQQCCIRVWGQNIVDVHELDCVFVVNSWPALEFTGTHWHRRCYQHHWLHCDPQSHTSTTRRALWPAYENFFCYYLLLLLIGEQTLGKLIRPITLYTFGLSLVCAATKMFEKMGCPSVGGTW